MSVVTSLRPCALWLEEGVLASSVNISQVGSDPRNKGLWKVTVVETNATSTSEVSLVGLPNVGRVIRQASVKTSGTATTVDPILGVSTDPSGVSVVVENGTAGASVNNEPNNGQGASYAASDNTLYHRSRPDSGTDNSITTIYYIIGGW